MRVYIATVIDEEGDIIQIADVDGIEIVTFLSDLNARDISGWTVEQLTVRVDTLPRDGSTVHILIGSNKITLSDHLVASQE